MDVSHELLIDVGLNVVGYLAAGLLSILLYSRFAKSTKSEASNRRTETGLRLPMPSHEGKHQTAEAGTNPSLEFIELGNSEDINVCKPAKPASRRPRVTETYRRNRLKVISTARQMLNAGTPENKVKSLLPISDAELNLLMIGKG